VVLLAEHRDRVPGRAPVAWALHEVALPDAEQTSAEKQRA